MPLLRLPEPDRSSHWQLKALTGALVLAAGALLANATWRLAAPYLPPAPPPEVTLPETLTETWTADTTPVALRVAGYGLRVPANLLRYAEQREGGPQARIDLVLRWPDLAGYHPSRASLFRPGAANRGLVLASLHPTGRAEPGSETPGIDITASQSPRRVDVAGPTEDPARLGLAVERFPATGREGARDRFSEILPPPLPLQKPQPSQTPEQAADAARAGEEPASRPAPDSEGRGATEAFAQSIRRRLASRTPYAVTCAVEARPGRAVLCRRSVEIMDGLTLTYRFERAYLTDWGRLERTVRARMASMLTGL